MNTTSIAKPGMSRAITFIFAAAGAVAVGNLYWSQPLLGTIATAFHMPLGSAGFLVTVTQIGYALGILLLVPLGDVVNRRTLIPAVVAASGVALALAAFAPSFAALLIALVCTGLLTTGGQMLPPLAGDLATPEQRGTVVGTISSGMLTGVLLSRAISGFVGDAFGWRAVFALAAAISFGLAVVLKLWIPPTPKRTAMPYLQLIVSVFSVVKSHAVARATLVIGACCFAVFSMFWTGLTFLLTAAPFNYSLSQVGLMGLVGLAGALAAKNAGRLHDKGLAVPAQGLALAVSLASVAVAAFAAHSIVSLVIVVIAIDAAIMSINVLNQVRLMAVDETARSRLNAAFVVANFLGGAAGSALASTIWGIGGWTGLMTAAGAAIAVAALVWARWRERFRALQR